MLVLALAACSGQASPGESGSDTADVAAASSGAPAFNEALHAELIQLLDADQAERQGEGALNDAERTDRLKEIIAEHGWPTISLVGKDGEDAAWAIAQHSDHDPQFQAQALELIAAAVEQGEASPGTLAYLTDRVATGQGEPQVYGTQVGCGPEGPEPAEPMNELAEVEAARAQVGLTPLSDYLAEMAQICAQDESGAPSPVKAERLH